MINALGSISTILNQNLVQKDNQVPNQTNPNIQVEAIVGSELNKDKNRETTKKDIKSKKIKSEKSDKLNDKSQRKSFDVRI